MIRPGIWDTFLTLTGEKLLLVQRKHVFVVVMPILFTSLSGFFLLFCDFFLFIHTLDSFSLFFTTALLIISVVLSFITKIIIDWYFHLYILTNRKMLEVWYTPLASHVMSDVLLDKVNCTEIDLRVNGFIHELIDMGDVIITFDRPTQQEVFVLKDIENSHDVGKFLTTYLMDHEPRNSTQPIWYRRSSNVVPTY
jgi:hypothetical protein